MCIRDSLESAEHANQCWAEYAAQLEAKISNAEANQALDKTAADERYQALVVGLEAKTLAHTDALRQLEEVRQGANDELTVPPNSRHTDQGPQLQASRCEELEKELSRMRDYSMQVEEAFNDERDEAERRIQMLESELAKHVHHSSVHGHESGARIDQLSAQLEQLQISYDDKCEESETATTALSNLQNVLVEFSEQRSQDMASLNQELALAKESASQTQLLKDKLNLSNQDLVAALDAKFEMAQQLERREAEVQKLELQSCSLTSALEDNLRRLRENTCDSNSVDKRLMIKLIVNYFKVKGSHKLEILHAMERILGFNEEESAAVGLRQTGWMEWLGVRDSGKAKAQEVDPTKDSFRDLFEDFLRNDTKNEMKEHLPPDIQVGNASSQEEQTDQ
eukprot:TRINITY_DN14285_c0_g2_i1.p1 TRINITY_DN14285_c0_g2~~TRINITY_DN14285_c0_g2_i1.p1  ORF type:complete len:395 (+),score=91.92 TRINITY_DN14285_c0_g2_i1:145-1329(+)